MRCLNAFVSFVLALVFLYVGVSTKYNFQISRVTFILGYLAHSVRMLCAFKLNFLHILKTSWANEVFRWYSCGNKMCQTPSTQTKQLFDFAHFRSICACNRYRFAIALMYNIIYFVEKHGCLLLFFVGFLWKATKNRGILVSRDSEKLIRFFIVDSNECTTANTVLFEMEIKRQAIRKMKFSASLTKIATFRLTSSKIHFDFLLYNKTTKGQTEHSA